MELIKKSYESIKGDDDPEFDVHYSTIYENILNEVLKNNQEKFTELNGKYVKYMDVIIDGRTNEISDKFYKTIANKLKEILNILYARVINITRNLENDEIKLYKYLNTQFQLELGYPENIKNDVYYPSIYLDINNTAKIRTSILINVSKYIKEKIIPKGLTLEAFKASLIINDFFKGKITVDYETMKVYEEGKENINLYEHHILLNRIQKILEAHIKQFYSKYILICSIIDNCYNRESLKDDMLLKGRRIKIFKTIKDMGINDLFKYSPEYLTNKEAIEYSKSILENKEYVYIMLKNYITNIFVLSENVEIFSNNNKTLELAIYELCIRELIAISNQSFSISGMKITKDVLDDVYGMYNLSTMIDDLKTKYQEILEKITSDDEVDVSKELSENFIKKMSIIFDSFNDEGIEGLMEKNRAILKSKVEAERAAAPAAATAEEKALTDTKQKQASYIYKGTSEKIQAAAAEARAARLEREEKKAAAAERAAAETATQGTLWNTAFMEKSTDPKKRQAILESLEGLDNSQIQELLKAASRAAPRRSAAAPKSKTRRLPVDELTRESSKGAKKSGGRTKNKRTIVKSINRRNKKTLHKRISIHKRRTDRKIDMRKKSKRRTDKKKRTDNKRKLRRTVSKRKQRRTANKRKSINKYFQ